MAAVLAIALKDLKLLFRVRAAFFFTMVWPLLVAVIFGSLFGGGMVPLAVMPEWMQSVSAISPVKWMIVAYEGAIWRGFSMAEMAVPCAILVTIGVVAFALGARRFHATLA